MSRLRPLNCRICKCVTLHRWDMGYPMFSPYDYAATCGCYFSDEQMVVVRKTMKEVIADWNARQQ